jgi:excisionase family DNA binding protein
MVLQRLVSPNPRQLLTVEELADQLQVPVNTIYGWRSRGEGPTGRKIGRYVRYRQEDVDDWLYSRTAK